MIGALSTFIMFIYVCIVRKACVETDALTSANQIYLRVQIKPPEPVFFGCVFRGQSV